METFAKPRRFVTDPGFDAERKQALQTLVLSEIDAPIRGLIERFSKLPCCFTLQCCFGHFVHREAPLIDNFEPLPDYEVGAIRYRIAYLALCIKNSDSGKRLYAAMKNIQSIDPQYVQFGSPAWFWERQVNSFALQVEPARYAFQDQADVGYAEALHLQKVRNRFYQCLEDLVHEQINDE